MTLRIEMSPKSSLGGQEEYASFPSQRTIEAISSASCALLASMVQNLLPIGARHTDAATF